MLFRSYDGLNEMECELHDVVITKEMVRSCRHSHMRYYAHVEEQNKNKKDEEMETRRKKLRLEVDECKKKEHRLEADANRLLDKADKLCEDAEHKNRMTLLIEANGLIVHEPIPQILSLSINWGANSHYDFQLEQCL